MNKQTLFFRGNNYIFINLNNHFIYEVSVYCRFKKYFSRVNNVLFISKKELSIVPTFNVNANTIIRCELYSAPFEWIKENDYKLYVPPEKKSKIIKNKENEKKKISVS